MVLSVSGSSFPRMRWGCHLPRTSWGSGLGRTVPLPGKQEVEISLLTSFLLQGPDASQTSGIQMRRDRPALVTSSLRAPGVPGSSPSGDPSFPARHGLRPDCRAHRGGRAPVGEPRANLPRRPSSPAARADRSGGGCSAASRSNRASPPPAQRSRHKRPDAAHPRTPKLRRPDLQGSFCQ